MVSAPLGQDAMFFSRLVQEVQSERRKEETRERRMEEPPQVGPPGPIPSSHTSISESSC